MSRAAYGHVAMLMFSALVAGSFSMGALVANQVPPMALMALRLILASAILALVVRATIGFSGHNALRQPWRYFILGGLYGAYFVLMFEALKTAAPVSTAAIFTLAPVVAGLFGYVLLRQRWTRRMALALSVGGIGALWVIFRADLSALLRFEVGQGEMIYGVGMVAHALYAPLVMRLNKGEPVLIFAFWVLAAGSVILTALGWSDIVAVDWGALSWLVWVVLIYVTVMATAVSTLCVQFASLRLPSAKVMAYTYLTPTWVICWEMALGHGVPSGLVLIGVGLTVVALMLLLKDEHS